MIFNSAAFLFFFPIVVALYFILPYKYRWILLLVASYFYYMYWKVEYILLIALSTLVDYFVAIKMSGISDKIKRRPYLFTSIVLNMGILFTFKYFNFFSENVNLVLKAAHMEYAMPMINVLLPIGISFYTFQTVSYSIDVYRGKIEPERNLGVFALFVTYFPQLVAGPIERADGLMPQLRRKFDFDYDRVTSGLKQMGWGFFKKVVIADQLGPMADHMWNNPENFGGVSTLLAIYFFGYQVYCDFSGYSDIAIGASRVFGIKLSMNFQRPFCSRSIIEFWSRWHITLVRWFKLYLFMPLVRNTNLPWPWYYNVVWIYLFSGIWHGANWTFIVWGAINAALILISRVFAKTKEDMYKFSGLKKFPALDWVVQSLITFHLLVIVAVYFRSPDLTSAHLILKNLFTEWGKDINEIVTNANGRRSEIFFLGFNAFEFASAIFMLVSLIIIEFFEEIKGNLTSRVNNLPIIIRWSLYLFLIILIMLFSFDRVTPFIYFQF